MLREEVLISWEDLKELILSNQQCWFVESSQFRRLKENIWSLKDLFDSRIIMISVPDPISELGIIKSELEQEKSFVSLLKDKINQISLSNNDSDFGPTLEEVD